MSEDMLWAIGIAAYLCAGLTVGLVREYLGVLVDSEDFSRAGRLAAMLFVWPLPVAVGVLFALVKFLGAIGDTVLGPEQTPAQGRE